MNPTPPQHPDERGWGVLLMLLFVMVALVIGIMYARLHGL